MWGVAIAMHYFYGKKCAPFLIYTKFFQLYGYDSTGHLHAIYCNTNDLLNRGFCSIGKLREVSYKTNVSHIMPRPITLQLTCLFFPSSLLRRIRRCLC